MLHCAKLLSDLQRRQPNIRCFRKANRPKFLASYSPHPMKKIFIDGEAGTTGLQIRQRLENLPDIALLRIDPARRKDPAARQALMAEADLVVLCLHDEAAVEAVALLDAMASTNGAGPKVIDASTAHRTAAGWVYGFPELAPGQSEAVAQARRVSNPGCYATGAIALIRPLVDAGLLPRDFPVCLPAVSGYSGGGRSMMEAYEQGQAAPLELYALGLKHKHIPEIMRYTGLNRRPLFVPSVANFAQGMLVQLPLHLDTLPGQPSAQDLHQALQRHYAHSRWVSVLPVTPDLKLDAVALANTNRMELRVLPTMPPKTALPMPCWLRGWTTWARGPAVLRCRTCV